MEERLIFIFGTLGILKEDSDVYIRTLIELGYDDAELSLQDILVDNLDFIKVGHRVRFLRYVSALCANEAPLAELILLHDPLTDLPESPKTPLVIIRKPLHTRDAIIVLKVIGCGSSGRVFKCLYAPTLTFVAVWIDHLTYTG